ncbi:MAG: extracellular solute-binding protein [Bacilli bacterium]|nr:extracellular solute-binding protein [Bacilli bacterium]
MKHKKLLFVLLTLSSLTLSGCTFKFDYNVDPYPFDDTLPDEDDDEGEYNIKVWCDKSILTLTQTQIAAFESLNGGKYKLTVNVEPESEGDAASDMLQDVQSGADIFCFAQDQLSRLKIAGALMDITSTMADSVKSDNMKGAVNAATYGGNLCAFPMTSDNGYFMYYDKSVLNESDILNMDTIIAKCKAAGKRINYKVFADGFYAASYFMATGCYSKWSIDPATGNFTGYEDTYKANGMPAMKALQKLKASDLVSPNDQTNKLGDTAAVAISGIWNYAAAKQALGENLGCAPMPSFIVDGQSYHISSYSGFKLIGVKPQTDSKKASVCRKIARYLTNQQCQTERFNEAGWGPSNIAASKEQAVLDQPGLAALAAQAEFANEQNMCPGSWWSNVATLSSSVKADSTEADFKNFLEIYDSNLEGLKDD